MNAINVNLLKNKDDIRHFKEVLFFDENVKDIDILLESVDKYVGLLPASKGNVLSQLSDLIISGVQKVHIIGHGEPGNVILAGFSLNESAWDEIARVIRINDSSDVKEPFFGVSDAIAKNYIREYVFKKNMQFNFWSCKTGDGVMGKKYTQKISDLLNANVNASSSQVGHEKLGGNLIKTF